jgi:hypothetical protein
MTALYRLLAGAPLPGAGSGQGFDTSRFGALTNIARVDVGDIISTRPPVTRQGVSPSKSWEEIAMKKLVMAAAVAAAVVALPMQAQAWGGPWGGGPWGGGPWSSGYGGGPWSGLGDMFGDVDANFSSRGWGRGSGYTYPYYGGGYGYPGYGGYPGWGGYPGYAMPYAVPVAPAAPAAESK